MSNYVRYSKSTPGRELTPGLWSSKLEAWANDPSVGIYRFEDFTTPRTNTTDASTELGWFIQDAAAGGTTESFVSVAGNYGEARLSADTGTDHFGIEAHFGATATSLGIIALPTHTTAGQGDVCFETRVKIDDAQQWFIGLTEPIVEFLSNTSTLPTGSDYIGFFRHDGGAIRLVAANDNNGGTEVTFDVTLLTTAEATALQALGYIKLGFCVRADGGVDIYVNGKPYTKVAATKVSKLALPIELLTYKLGVYRDATGDNATVGATFDWIASFVETV